MFSADDDSALRAQLLELRAHLRGPYPGLRAFRRDEAQIFFGRDEQIDSILGRLKTTRLVAIAGESGCGKSSLVRAGLLPALEAGFLPEGAGRWRVAELRPGDRPIHHLAQALSRALAPAAVAAEATNATEFLEARLRCGPRSIADLLHDDPIPAGTELLIVVDQFEELIRFRDRTRPDEADAFVALLMATIRDHTLPVRVVLTLRTEYLGRCAIFHGLPELLNDSQYLVPRLGRDQLLQTILYPARLFDGQVDATLANQLINELSQNPDQLPVMEHALLLLWRHPRQERPPSHSERGATSSEGPKALAYEAYAALGGASKALDDHAEQVYAALPDDEHKRIARRLFCALWDEKASGSDTRHPCRVREAAELAGTTTDALKRVADAFRSNEHSFLMPPPTTPLADDTPLDVCHESLFRHWRALQGWIRDLTKDVEQYQQWCRLALDRRVRNGDLLRDRLLERALEWRRAVQRNDAWVRRYSDHPDDFDRVEDFLRESVKLRKRNRLLRFIGVIVILLGLAIAVMHIWKAKRDEEKSAAQSEQLRQQVYSTAALSAQRLEPMRSLQLALEAQGNDPGSQAEATLHIALRTSHLRGIVFPSRNRFDDARFLPDGGTIATVGEADGLALWDASTGKRVRAFYGATPSRIAIASSGKLVATASNDGSIDLWDLESVTHRWTQHVQISRITDIAFSPDDSLLATASDDGRAVVWTATSGAENHVLIDHLGTVSALAFSHDSARLATAGADGRIVLWDANTGQELGLLAHLPDITMLAFQATGGLVAVASRNGVALFDPITRREEGTLSHSSRVTSVAFSPDGKRIAAVASDGELRVWDAGDRTERLRIPAEIPSRDAGKSVADTAGASSSVAFSADSRELVTTGPDGTARVWEVEESGELAAFRAHEAAIRRISVSADGKRIATASDDGTAALWDLHGRELLRTPRSVAVKAMALNRAGTLMVISEGSWLKVLDEKRSTIAAWEAPDEIRDLRLFHDGDRVAVAAGRHVAVWNIAERRLMFDQDPGVDVDAVAIDVNEQWLASECGDPPGAEPRDAHHRLCLWDTRGGQRIATLSPVAAASDGHDTPNQKADPHQRAVLALTVGEDGRWLASASEDSTIKIWDIESRHLRVTLPGHRASVSGLAASPDGRLLVSSGNDWARLWDARNYKRRDEFPDAESPSDSVAFAPDSHWFAAGGRDGVVRLFSVDGEVLRALARDRVPLTLPSSECQRHMQRDCDGLRTARQLANEGRLLLQSGASALGERYLLMAATRNPAAFGMESLRIISTQWLRAAMTVATPLDTSVAPSDSDSSDADDKDRIVRSIAAALDAGQRRGEQLVQRARDLDSAIVVDPADLMAATAIARVASIARVFAERESPGLATRILALAPRYGAREGWAEHAATALTSAKAIRDIIGHVAARQYNAAVDVLRLQFPRPRSAQRQILLRFIATAYDHAGQLREAAQLAEQLYPWANDVEVLVSLADILLRARRSDKALAALDRALAFDPVNDPALLLLARAYYESGQIARAASILRQVSPLTPIYRDAVGLAGVIVYDKLERLAEGYRTMVLAVDSKDAASWARLAESAWATNRLAEARLIANRVIEARAVERSSPDVELAMRFVLVAALCRAQQYDAAEIELDRLIALAPLVGMQGWSYAGSRAAASRLKTGPAKLFIQALLAYSESLGRTGDPEELRKLLHDARDAHRY